MTVSPPVDMPYLWQHSIYHGLATSDDTAWIFNMGIDLTNPGEPRNDLVSAKNKYVNGQALGFDLLDSTGSGGFSWDAGIGRDVADG